MNRNAFACRDTSHSFNNGRPAPGFRIPGNDEWIQVGSSLSAARERKRDTLASDSLREMSDRCADYCHDET